MTMKHRGEYTPLWYRAFYYRWLEQQIVHRPDVQHILDLGCGGGENMWRLSTGDDAPLGLDPSGERLHKAQEYGPVVQGSALDLPFADGSLDMVYAAHVLHHIDEPTHMLGEIKRCLRPGGFLFLIETVEDHPLIRLGRNLHPVWHGDDVETRLYFAEVKQAVRQAGFKIQDVGRYSVLFWIWELLPTRWPIFDWFTPAIVALEAPAQRILKRWAAHAYFLCRKE